MTALTYTSRLANESCNKLYLLVDFQLCFYSNVIFSNMGSRSSVRPNHPPLALSANFSFLIQMMFQLYITQWHNNILLDNC
jgi:hypothetical protein